MFKVLIIACGIFPFPRGEIIATQCYFIQDQWQPTAYGYYSKKTCEKRLKKITDTIRENYMLMDIKEEKCIKSQDREVL